MAGVYIDPNRLRTVVADAVKRQRPDVAERLRLAISEHGVSVAPIKDADGMYVVLVRDTPIAKVHIDHLAADHPECGVGFGRHGWSHPDGTWDDAA